MADDNNQRPFRNPYARTPLKNSAANDPLAELARLIGQTDPFAEFGLKPQQSPGAAQPHPGALPDWGAKAQNYAPAPGYEHHAAIEPGIFRTGRENAGYESEQHAAGYDSAGYYDDVQSGEGGHDYDDVPPSRSRLKIIAIAAVLALAVVGTAGAFGYRALFGSSGSSAPPVIKADTAPAKVVPPSKTEPQSNKLIYDRVGERSSGEKIVSREEQPIDINKPTQANAFPNAIAASQATATPATSVGANPADQPKKIHTIVIRPDQPQGVAEPTPAPAPVRAIAAKPAPTPPKAPQRLASAPPISTADAEEAAPIARAAAPARPAAPSRSANAPLSLSPDASAPAAPRVEPIRTASAPVRNTPPPAASPTGQYVVQVSSQRSEADAEASFRALQGKYPTQLGNRQPIIRRADLGSKGVYYRAMVGPFGNSGEAAELCQSLKSAGGSCLIQKN